MTLFGITRSQGQSLCLAVMLVALVVSVPVAHAYEVWVTDQSDTGKESGGYLHIYDGAKLAADPASAKPSQTIDLSGEIGKFCEDATKKAVRRPHMVFFNAAQDHVIISFLSGHVLFMDVTTKKPEACLSMGKNAHAAWPTPNQKMAIAANILEKKFIRIWTDYAAHKYSFDPETDVLHLAAFEGGERPRIQPAPTRNQAEGSEEGRSEAVSRREEDLQDRARGGGTRGQRGGRRGPPRPGAISGPRRVRHLRRGGARRLHPGPRGAAGGGAARSR